MGQLPENCETTAKRESFNNRARTRRRWRRIAVCLALAVLMPGLAGIAGESHAARPAAVGANASVSMDCAPNCQFGPASLTVLAGTTVVWNGVGLSAHTSTSNTGIWDSGLILSGQSFSQTFDTPGIFPYQCTVHSLLGMTGSINVVAVDNQIFMPFLGKESSGS